MFGVITLDTGKLNWFLRISSHCVEYLPVPKINTWNASAYKMKTEGR